MGVQTTAALFITLLVGTLALPQLQNEIDSPFFIHTDPAARIVGGTPAAPGSVPYMVGLTQGTWVRSFLCGGSLISVRTVLTAAHCIAAVFSWGQLSSTLQGTVGTNVWSSGGQSFSFARNVTHANYVSATIKNDIGLLITNQNVALSNVVGIVPLSFAWVPGGISSRAAGWGRIVQGGALASSLLELFVTTIEGSRCITDVALGAAAANMIAPPVEPHIEICTVHSPAHGMCNGDSGSALVRADNGQQIAIVSWGIPCARGAPDMFVRVSAYQNWINQNIV